MAIRPVYASSNDGLVTQSDISFEWYPGLSLTQKRRSVTSLHQAALTLHPEYKLLEVSSKSELELGVALSAFNLSATIDGKLCSVESLFQGSKVFELGGPYTDLYELPAHMAKKYECLRSSGQITGFKLLGMPCEIEPKKLFYSCVYLSALQQNPALYEALLAYNAFTDIEFNPKKSLNSQAHSCALFVTLVQNGQLTPEARIDFVRNFSRNRELLLQVHFTDPQNLSDPRSHES